MLSYHTMINLFHVFVVVPLIFLLYAKRKQLNPSVCKAILITAIIILLFPIGAYIKIKDPKRRWVFLLHIFIIVPIFAMIGYKCKDTPRKYFEMALIVAFAALGYHSYNAVKYSILKN